MDQINLVLDTSIIYDLIGLGASACNKKYIRYDKTEVYALYYKKAKIIYYNIDFRGRTQLIVIIF